MGLYMRAILGQWDDPPFQELVEFVQGRSGFRVDDIDNRGWIEFEAVDEQGQAVLAADLAVGEEAREELDELEDFLADLEGSAKARDAVRAHLLKATAVVGMQVLPSVHEQSVAAANVIIEYLERRPNVLTQVDTVGWYDGSDLILQEPE